MVVVTEAIGNVGRHVASHPPRTGAAVRASTRDPEPRTTDPATSRIAAELGA